MSIGGMRPSPSQDLQSLADPAAFLAALRRLKNDSGLSYRKLEARAAAAGDVLPRSTAFTLLHREIAPDPDQLAALVRACGDGDRVAEWLAVRDRIVWKEAVPPQDRTVPRPARESGTGVALRFPGGGTRLTLAVSVAVALIAGVGTAVLLHRHNRAPSAQTTAAPTVSPAPRAGFTLFEGRSRGGSTAASVGYRYWDTRDGWYGIEYVVPHSRDLREGRRDGWGGTLRMHYEDRHGSHVTSLTVNTDGHPDVGQDSVRYGLKNVWFDVCDSGQPDRLRGCQRLRMAR
ncbi:hypothetical protein CRV15_35755 (plasmid) [Streptomyces clavuligerus]|uniref:XRE family transcriptional regulator n=2 Tax=Streptomyces clavuligerus TaxID=1901 RepID=D5SMC3_STRCL|nr:Hypothetical protein SCLAV_p1585 [Streptomyces clavuligerus]QCS10860.1 hypothetical protein CRV15_35755 [Streptomyces clavuligerus]